MSSPQQLFRLHWKNHSPNFITCFSQLLNSESLVDVTLAADGKQIQAHRVVLSACSTYFQVFLFQHMVSTETRTNFLWCLSGAVCHSLLPTSNSHFKGYKLQRSVHSNPFHVLWGSEYPARPTRLHSQGTAYILYFYHYRLNHKCFNELKLYS